MTEGRRETEPSAPWPVWGALLVSLFVAAITFVGMVAFGAALGVVSPCPTAPAWLTLPWLLATLCLPLILATMAFNRFRRGG